MLEVYMEEWVNLIIRIEGMHLMPYQNLRGMTCIGVGRCLGDFPLNTEERKALGDYMHGITENGAKMLLRDDILRCYEVLKKQRRRISEMENPNMNTDIKRKGSELNIGSVIQMVYSGKIYTVVGFVKKKLVYKLVVMGKDGSEKEIWDNPALYKIIK